jgi:hypothetical protein
VGNLKTRYRKLQAFADGGTVLAEAPQVTAAPIPDPVVEPDELDQSGLPDTAKAWLRSHDEFLYDENASARLADLHFKVVDEGLEPYSPAYFRRIEQRLEQPPASGDVDQAAVDRVLAEARHSAPRPKAAEPDNSFESSRRIYSAPPSRSVPQSNGRGYLSNDLRSVDMTPAMKEAAAIAGISIQEYARQVIRLRQEKEMGNHGGQP